MDGRFVQKEFSAQDGLRLSYREYGDAASGHTPILCLAGLTGNAVDFHDFALHYGHDRRVIALDYRGRGRSAYDPDPGNYWPDVYSDDVLQLLAAANMHQPVVVGTSLGGLLAMMIAVQRPTTFTGVILNDIGPEIGTTRLERIKYHLANGVRPENWIQATA